MLFAAVKMDCFHPRATELKVSSNEINMLRLDRSWLVYQVKLGQTILLQYNEGTRRHELPPR